VCTYLNPVRLNTGPVDGLEDFIIKSQTDTLQAVLRSPVLNLAAELHRFLTSEAEARTVPMVQLTNRETTLLAEEMGLEARKVNLGQSSSFQALPYRTIIVVIVESFHRDYLHYYNPAIPAEATAFLDSLLIKYPRLDNYYCSAMPTDFGLNAMLMSSLRMPSRSEFARLRPRSVFERLKAQLGPQAKAYMIRGESIHYGNSFILHKRLFGVDELIAKEQLLSRYTDPDVASGWGVHDPYLYKEVIRILKERSGSPTIIFSHNIDMHQPGSYSGLKAAELPMSIAQHGESILPALKWMDDSLRGFFADLEREGLFSEDTLVIITGDHSPHPGEEVKRWVLPQNYRRLAPIPLIFVSKNLEPFRGWAPGRLASQVDFAPTLAGLLGQPERPGDFGVNLLADASREVALGYYNREIFVDTMTARMSVPFIVNPSELSGGTRDHHEVRTVALNKWLRNLEAAQ